MGSRLDNWRLDLICHVAKLTVLLVQKLTLLSRGTSWSPLPVRTCEGSIFPPCGARLRKCSRRRCCAARKHTVRSALLFVNALRTFHSCRAVMVFNSIFSSFLAVTWAHSIKYPCALRRCQVEKVPDYVAAKILTFEPSLPSFRQSYTVFDTVGDGEPCLGGACEEPASSSATGQRSDSFSLSVTSQGSASPRARTLLQSVGNLQEAVLKMCVRECAACCGPIWLVFPYFFFFFGIVHQGSCFMFVDYCAILPAMQRLWRRVP